MPVAKPVFFSGGFLFKKTYILKNDKTAAEYNMKIKYGILYKESHFKILLKEKTKIKHPASKSVLDKTVLTQLYERKFPWQQDDSYMLPI